MASRSAGPRLLPTFVSTTIIDNSPFNKIRGQPTKFRDQIHDTISTKKTTNSKLKENMKSYDWKELIRSYYTTNNAAIPTNIVFYIPEKKITQFCLNQYIIDYGNLTQENIMLDLFMDYSDNEED